MPVNVPSKSLNLSFNDTYHVPVSVADAPECDIKCVMVILSGYTQLSVCQETSYTVTHPVDIYVNGVKVINVKPFPKVTGALGKTGEALQNGIVVGNTWTYIMNIPVNPNDSVYVEVNTFVAGSVTECVFNEVFVEQVTFDFVPSRA